jgi:lysophospholipase L1-like esterase
VLLIAVLSSGTAEAFSGTAEAKKHHHHKHHHHHKPTKSGWKDVAAYQGAGGASYVAYGDSLTHGYGSTLPYPSLLTYYREQDAGQKLTLYNYGVNGFWSSQLVDLLSSPSIQADDTKARYITVSIGYNDLSQAKLYYLGRACGGADGQQCYRDAITRFKGNWNQILNRITSTCDGAHVAVATQYEALVAEGKATYTRPPKNDHKVHKQYLEEMNAYIKRTAAAKRIAVADLHTLMNGTTHDQPIPAAWLYDAAHPNATGDIKIADAFRALGTSPNCYG